MPDTKTDLSQYLEKVPKPEEIRRELTANLREAKLLRQLLRISEQRQQVEEVSSCR
jgi:hypothetical protein